jgi:hypothetical protein
VMMWLRSRVALRIEVAIATSIFLLAACECTDADGNKAANQGAD